MRTLLPRRPYVTELLQQVALEKMEFSPQTAIKGYFSGFFPMPAGSNIHWHLPAQRANVPINDFHVPKNLKRLVRQQKFEIRYDTSFNDVIHHCADRNETWIDENIISVYTRLSEMGVAKCVEAWLDGELAGGIYGICIGRYFVTESQFHLVRDAGKVAFVSLLETLKSNGYLFHDVQIISPYIEQFGAVEIPNSEFQQIFPTAMVQSAPWPTDES